MNIAEFEQFIRIGHGRAVSFLWETEDDTPYQDVILEACFHNQAPQPVFDVRADYIYSAIVATDNEDFYEPHVIEALLNLPNDVSGYDEHQLFRLEFDVKHLYHLVWLFVLEGSEQARAAIYRKAAESIALADFFGAYQVVRMDGMDGFLFAAEHIGRCLLETDSSALEDRYSKYYIDTFLFEKMENRYGITLDLETLARTYADDTTMTAYFDAVRASRAPSRDLPEKWSNPRKWDYVTLQQKIAERKTDLHSDFRWWGKDAAESDLALAAADLLTQTDPLECEAYLAIFNERAFPLDPMLLVPYTRYADRSVMYAAFSALAMIKHPSVRAFALDAIRDRFESAEAVQLLNVNFEPGDWALIEALTAQPFADLNERHRLQINAYPIAKTHPDPACVGTLINLYESGPCAFCREYVIRLLHDHDAFSDEMREECKYDANDDIQRLMFKGFSAESSDE